VNGTHPAGKGYDTFPFRRATPEQMYTAAHLAYARGADGVSAFNFAYYREHGGLGRGPFSEPPFEVFRRLGDRPWLARQPQHYFLSTGWGNPFTRRPGLPRKLSAGKSATFTLDLAPPSGGWRQGGQMRIQGATPLGDSRWEARFNDQVLTPTPNVAEPYPDPYPPLLGQPDEMRAWQVPPAALRDGANRLDVMVRAGEKLVLAFLDLAVQ
jgi:hypothetical protein